jgi:uncharacterized protein (DUF2267 family)
MQKLVQSIVEKTGISEAQAQSALETTLTTLKGKLPASIGNQLEGLLTDKEFDFKAVVNEKISELKVEATEKLEDLKEEAAEKFEDLKEGFKKMF